MSTQDTVTLTNPTYEQYLKSHLLKGLRFDVIVPSEKQEIIDRFSEKLSQFRTSLAHTDGLTFNNISQQYENIFDEFNSFRKEILPNSEKFAVAQNIKTSNGTTIETAFLNVKEMKKSEQFSPEDILIGSEIFRLFFAMNKHTSIKENSKVVKSYEDKIKSGFFKESANSEYSQSLNQSNDELLKSHATLYEQDGYKETFRPEVQQFCTNNQVCGFFNYGETVTQQNVIKTLDNFNAQAETASQALGLSKDCMTFNGNLSISMNHDSSAYASFTAYNFSMSVRPNTTSVTLAHEWTHALDNHLHNKLNSEMKAQGLATQLMSDEDEDFISSKSTVLPTENVINSPTFFAARELKGLVREFSFDPSDKITEERTQLANEICGDFWMAAMGEQYFTLPPEVKKDFESTITLLAIKDVTYNSKILDGSFVANDTVHPTFAALLEKHNISCNGAKSMLRSIAPHTQFQLHLNNAFTKFDNVLIGEDSPFINNSRHYSHDNKGKDFNSDEYHTNNVELLARYTESHIAPQSSKRDNNESNAIAIDNSMKDSLAKGKEFIESDKKSMQYFDATKESLQHFHGSMQSIFAKTFGEDKLRTIVPQDHLSAVLFNEIPNKPNGPQFKKSTTMELAALNATEGKLDTDSKDLVDFILKKGKWEYLKNEKKDTPEDKKKNPIFSRVTQAFNNLIQSAGTSFMNWLYSDNDSSKKNTQKSAPEYTGFSDSILSVTRSTSNEADSTIGRPEPPIRRPGSEPINPILKKPFSNPASSGTISTSNGSVSTIGRPDLEPINIIPRRPSSSGLEKVDSNLLKLSEVPEEKSKLSIAQNIKECRNNLFPDSKPISQTSKQNKPQ